MSFLYAGINSSEKLSTGFILSSGIYISLCFPLGLINNGYTPISFLLLSLAILCITFLLNYLFLKKQDSEQIIVLRNSKIVKTIAIISISILFSSFITNIYWPVRDWDAITLYDFRAKLFAEEGKIPDILYDMEPNYYLAYPFFTSLVHTNIYVLSNVSPVIYYTLITAAFCLSFYHILKRKSNPITAAIGTLFLISTYDIYAHSLISYTNLPYIIYVFLGLIYSYDAKNNNRIYVLSSILVATSCWIRSDDPFWVISILLAFYFSYIYKKPIILMIYILIILSWRLTWSFYKDSVLTQFAASVFTEAPNYKESINIFISNWWGRLFQVSSFLIDKVLWYYNNYLAFLVLSTILAIKAKLDNTYLSKLVIFSFLVILFGGTYFLSFMYSKWDQVGGSAQRMMMILIPFIIFDSMITIFSYLNSKKDLS